MNRISLLAITLVSTFLSCNAQKTQDRTISAFNKIKISGAVSVIYTNSDTLSLSVKAKENDLDNIETKIENSTLIISSKGTTRSDLLVYVKNNQLKNLVASGASSFKTINGLTGDSLTFNLTGAADVFAKVNAKSLRCQEDGAASLVLEGSTDKLNVEISGASSLKSYNLLAKDAALLTSGASSAKVHVTEKLRATASSASEIKIMGDPKDVVTESSTAASVTRIKDMSSADLKSESDTTFLNWKNKKILIIGGSNESQEKTANVKDERFKHWRGFSMGINGYMNPGGGVNLNEKYNFLDLEYRKSLNFQFNIIERQINLASDNVKIITGFGFDYHLYEFANKTTLNADTNYTWGVIDSSNTYSYKRNKLRATYLQVPLLLEFNTSKDSEKSFHIAFGVIGQFLIASRTKQVLFEGKDKSTNVRKDGYYLSPFAAKAHINLGYRSWTFFGEYNLTPLFQSGKGPELYAFTAGIRVCPFG
ncbi:hypothetical protein CNR22_21995 [Sphingobacteriaceae bacterium]|nr:hypothetical protein CNR22_21995 [Sphingobacteriaceae bacterium]